MCVGLVMSCLVFCLVSCLVSCLVPCALSCLVLYSFVFSSLVLGPNRHRDMMQASRFVFDLLKLLPSAKTDGVSEVKLKYVLEWLIRIKGKFW